MNNFLENCIDSAAETAKDTLCSILPGGDKEEEKKGPVDQAKAMMGGLFGGGDEQEEKKDSGITDFLASAAGAGAGLVAKEKTTQKTKGMGDKLSGFAAETAGNAAAEQVSGEAKKMLSDLFTS